MNSSGVEPATFRSALILEDIKFKSKKGTKMKVIIFLLDFLLSS
jgi:hypothetical protein